MSHRRHEDFTRVYLRFRPHGSAWKCEFLLDGAGAPLSRTLTLANPEKITELAERGDGLPTLESRQMLEMGIHAGRGGIFLSVKGGAKLDHWGGEKVDHFIGGRGRGLKDLRGRLEGRPAARLAGRA